MTIPPGYSYIDYPNEGWMSEKWDWTHSIGCAVASFLYIIPGIIFLVWKAIAKQEYQSKYNQANQNNERAFDYTGCVYLSPARHLGGHPFLPYNKNILVGIDRQFVRFYSYGLKELHSVKIQDIHEADENISTDPILATTQSVSTDSNILKLKIPVEGVLCVAEFDLRYGKSHFWQVFNEALVELNN